MVERDSRSNASLVRELRRALRNLYDPDELRKSPLASLLCVDEPERPSSLQHALVAAIEALKPDAGVSAQSDAWRTYHTLSSRYVQQFSQGEVAEGLGLSPRQMRRQESLALRTLAEHLSAQYDLAPGAPRRSAAPSTGAEGQTTTNADALSREQELAWLEKSVPAEPVALAEMMEGLLETVQPLARALGVDVDGALSDDLPRLVVQPATIRQAFLNLLTAAIRGAPAGRVSITAQPQGDEVWVDIQPLPQPSARPGQADDCAESIDMARQLVGLSGGTLEVASGGRASPWARCRLPAAEQAVVLIVDDNADALQLFQRYLAGSRYGFAGAQGPEQAIAMAEKLAPRIILLDIMLPDVDGWEVLGRLREHPRTAGVPVIVCTILPQEQLAQALGAAGFLRKPISRADLLATLDRHSGLRSPVSPS